jgi:membrane protein
LGARIGSFVARIFTLGGLGWKELVAQVWARARKDDVAGRAAQLSYYFLLALFPLLIFVSTILGYIFTTQRDLYLRLLYYLSNVVPQPAFELIRDTLVEITDKAGSGKLTVGLLLTLWAASSGMQAIIEGLNVAYAVTEFRPWWRRRLVAMGLTIALGAIVGLSLFLIVAGKSVATGVGYYFPVLEQAGRLSTFTQWTVEGISLLTALTLIFRFAPNLRKRRLEANLPGAILSLACWLCASGALSIYLSLSGTLSSTYGSMAAVIVLLVWLYVSGAAILIGGELNSVIWRALAHKRPEDT